VLFLHSFEAIVPVKPNADILFTCFVCFLSVYQAYLMVSCISHDYSSYLIHVPTEELLKVIFFFLVIAHIVQAEGTVQ
jgi:hypothetical protein